jgi:hypothetical protein
MISPIRFLVSLALATTACQPQAQTPADEQAIVTKRASEVLVAFQTKDMSRLAPLVHPTRGVRFSPYPHVLESDRKFTRDEVASLWNDAKTFDWGAADGTGDPIVLPFPTYYGRFVYNHDFARAPKTAYTSAPIRPSNAISNLAAMYPGARWIEYHFAGFDPKYDGMDWSSLWLVFQREGAAWFLVGVVHGSWTI